MTADGTSYHPAKVGQTVVVIDSSHSSNGTLEHPGIITRVWGGCVNIKVLPDCGDPYDMTSVQHWLDRGSWPVDYCWREV